MREKLIIGRKDKADFPELELLNIEVKIDTGAYTSSIHCHDIEEYENNGIKYVKFDLLDPSHPEYNNKEFKTKNYYIKSIKSSSGESEQRFIIKTIIKLFNQDFETEFSLTDRSSMKTPVLLGRKLLKDLFIVDVSKTNLSFAKKPKLS